VQQSLGVVSDLIRKIATLAAGEFGARVLGILNFALLARALGVDGFGTFSFAMSFALVVGVAVDMGQNVHLGRVVARHGEEGALAFGQVVRNKIALTLAVLPLLYLGFMFAGFSNVESALVVLMSGWAALLSILDSMRSIARARGLMHLDSSVNTLESLARILAVAVAWYLGVGVLGYGAAFVLEALLAGVLFHSVLNRRITLKAEKQDRLRYRRFLQESATLGLVALAAAGFNRLDQVIVQGAVGAYANGLYGAAARVVFTATAAASIVINAFFPALASSVDDLIRYRSVLLRALLFAGGAGAIIAVSVVVFAGPIVRVLYGPSYNSAVPLLQIMGVVVLFNGLSVTGLYSASALNRERWTLLVVSALATASIAVGLLTIPRYGVVAAAWVSAGGEFLLAVSLLAVSADILIGSSVAKAAT
jgi:PST family polysaccharide transporter